MKEMPEVLTAHDIADILQITYPYALAFIKYSGVRYMKIGKQYRVLASDFYNFLEETENIDVDLSGVDQIDTTHGNTKKKK